jgi:hypothetical protein
LIRALIAAFSFSIDQEFGGFVNVAAFVVGE